MLQEIGQLKKTILFCEILADPTTNPYMVLLEQKALENIFNKRSTWRNCERVSRRIARRNF